MLHTSPLDLPGTKDAGGMNVVVTEQARALAAAGYEIDIYTRASDTHIPASVPLAPRLTVHSLIAGPIKLLPKGEHEALTEEFGAQLLKALHVRPAQIIHAEHWFSGIAALPIAKKLGVPLVQSYHSIAAPQGAPLSAGEGAESPGRIKGEKLLARECTAIAAVSRYERDITVERLGADPNKVHVVQLGVDTELFHPAAYAKAGERQKWIAGGGRPEVLVAGRLHPLKGFDLAVRAVAAIPQERRPALRIVGAPPPDGDAYACSIYRAIAESGIISVTSCDGALPRSEFAERLRRAALVLVPSHSETFGLVALEAAASGVPVIARKVGGLVEAVADGISGVLIEGGDPAKWATEIKRMLSSKKLHDRFAVNAREHALGRTWAASATSAASMYRHVLNTQM